MLGYINNSNDKKPKKSFLGIDNLVCLVIMCGLSGMNLNLFFMMAMAGHFDFFSVGMSILCLMGAAHYLKLVKREK